MDQQRQQPHAVAITMEKDSCANARSCRERRNIQRALGAKNIVLYVLVFINLLFSLRLILAWSRQGDNSNCNQYGSSSLFGKTTASKSGHGGEGEGEDASTPEFWLKMALIVGLVLIGGIFAGLTIGLMGLDETNLHVLMVAGSPKERIHAEKVYKLLSRGKHWVLVTLLLGNVIVNESLPVVLDSELGGGIIAILISTLLIVVFGEIIPQAVCARHGLAIGSFCSKPMLVLMYIMSPVAYPIAMLLDYWLGVHHGTTYRRTELKTLVSLHQVDGIGELTDDEVTIIASVLDLKEKAVSAVMTPLEDVFTLSEDAILDEKLTEDILRAGYSRIPVYRHDDAHNFIGMLLVKRLITYDPADHTPVRQFTLNSLPEAAPNTSCLDILNFFQEGRSHMAIVTSKPGGFGDPVGVITLEDVIEELLGEEIVDESDVYVDVHNKIKVIRKPSRNVSKLKNLKSLLQSPALNESTPLLGHNSSTASARTVTMPADSKYMTSGKTILSASRKNSSALLDTTTATNTAANTQPSTTVTAANGATGAVPAENSSATKDTTTAGSTEGEHHVVNFKDDVEVFKPTQESAQLEEEVEGERSVVIEVPEPTGTYSINPPETVIAAVEGAEAAKVAKKPDAETPKVTEEISPIVGDSTAVITSNTPAESDTITDTKMLSTSPPSTVVPAVHEAQTPVLDPPTTEVVEPTASSSEIPKSTSTSTLLTQLSEDPPSTHGPPNKRKKKKKKSTKW